MTATYPTAAIPEPFQILGYKLKPFCLGHFLLMMRFDCAFVAEEPCEPAVSDLLLGLLICSQTFEEFTSFLEKPGWLDQITEWGKYCGSFQLPEKIALFSRYLKEGSASPVVWFEKDGKESGAHWTQSLKISLHEIGYTHGEILNLPLSQAFADFYKLAENRGAVSIATPEEIEAMAELDREELGAKPA